MNLAKWGTDQNGTSLRRFFKEKLLSDLGYSPGPIDGLYGSKTSDAIKKFQRDNNLKQDGLTSIVTLEHLREVIHKQSESATIQQTNSNRSQGSKTQSFNIPANAHITGASWYCDNGYRKSGNKCVPIAN